MMLITPTTPEEDEECNQEYYEWEKENEIGFYELLSEERRKEITEDEFVVFELMPLHEDRLIKDGFKIDYDKWINWLADTQRADTQEDKERFKERYIRKVRPEIRKMLKQNERLVKKFPVLNKY